MLCNQKILNLQAYHIKQNEIFDACVVYVMGNIFTQNLTQENPKRRNHLGGRS